MKLLFLSNVYLLIISVFTGRYGVFSMCLDGLKKVRISIDFNVYCGILWRFFLCNKILNLTFFLDFY